MRLNRIPIFVALPIIALAVYFGAGLNAYQAHAAQPREDGIDVDLAACGGGTVYWFDGLQVAAKATISVNGIVKTTVTLDDIVGDQSGVIASFTAVPGDNVIARLYVGSEVVDSVERTIPACPTATATATATATNTAIPATSTPVPTSTPAPTQTPIVITNTVIQERVVVATPVVSASASTVRPPSTGDGGLR